jgi:gas vesicle protein
MENPFNKKENTALIVGVIAGAVVAGAVAYLFLTDTGTQVRQKLSGHLERVIAAITGRETEEPADDPAQDYLNHPKKHPKTDREKLLKHEALTDNESHDGEHGQQPA